MKNDLMIMAAGLEKWILSLPLPQSSYVKLKQVS